MGNCCYRQVKNPQLKFPQVVLAPMGLRATHTGRQFDLQGDFRKPIRGEQSRLVDCRKVTITSGYASKLVWRQTA